MEKTTFFTVNDTFIIIFFYATEYTDDHKLSIISE